MKRLPLASHPGHVRRLPQPLSSAAPELLPRLDDRGRLWFGVRSGGRPGRSRHLRGDAGQSRPLAGRQRRVRRTGTAANEYEASPSTDGRHLVVVADGGDRPHLYHFFEWRDGPWNERGKLSARQDAPGRVAVSPRGDRVLFAQADGDRSGGLFVTDPLQGAAREWPPACMPQRP